jgi:hypothetical protein
MAYHTTTDQLLANGLNNHNKKAAFIEENDNGTVALANAVNSITFSNIGAAIASITLNGTTTNLPIGASVSFDAGGADNRFAPNTFEWDSTGTILLIAYTY